jgi:hypothetical protein
MLRCRQHTVLIQDYSYIFPASIRHKLEEIWREDLSTWWLPNEEDFPPIVRSIRDFNVERSTAPSDEKGENLRDMKGLFKTLVLDGSSSPESPHNPTLPSNPPRVAEKTNPDTQVGGSEQTPYDEFGWRHGSPEFTWGFEQQEQYPQNQGFGGNLF